MKFFGFLLFVVVGVASAQQGVAGQAEGEGQGQGQGQGEGQNTDRNPVRFLPADVLRDFPGMCFASTMCRVFPPGESWGLTPFCGSATCLVDVNGMIERVTDCGPPPINFRHCKNTNEAEKEAVFPKCCPQYNCGAEGAIYLGDAGAEKASAVAEAEAAEENAAADAADAAADAADAAAAEAAAAAAAAAETSANETV